MFVGSIGSKSLNDFHSRYKQRQGRWFVAAKFVNLSIPLSGQNGGHFVRTRGNAMGRCPVSVSSLKQINLKIGRWNSNLKYKRNRLARQLFDLITIDARCPGKFVVNLRVDWLGQGVFNHKSSK
jgi:hypothetical protein